MDQMTTEEYMRAIDIPSIRGENPDAAAGRPLTTGEFNALLQVCIADSSPAGPRDASLLGLGVLGGLRREEMATLMLADYDQHTALLWVRGKRNKVRTVSVAPGVADALDDWLHLCGLSSDRLFLHIRKEGVVLPEGISPAAIYRIMQKRADEAGVKHFSPHDTRRTCAGNLLDAGADISTVQKFLGHANANTTAPYDRRGERAKRDAVNGLHMQWEKRY